MGLSKKTLEDEIRKFQDPDFGEFAGFPASASEAADKWSAAFDTYIKQMVVIAPSTVTPINTSATFASVKAAFRASLAFGVSIGANVGESSELSSSWAAGVNAITLVQGAQYAPPGAVAITAITPFSQVSAAQSALQSALLALFDNPSSNAAQRAREVADAIHTATTAAVVTTCTYTIPSSPPGTGPLSFG